MLLAIEYSSPPIVTNDRDYLSIYAEIVRLHLWTSDDAWTEYQINLVRKPFALDRDAKGVVSISCNPFNEKLSDHKLLVELLRDARLYVKQDVERDRED